MSTVPSFSANQLFAIFDSIGNWIFTAAIIIAPIIIIIGAFLFLTGGDNPNQVASGRKVMIWAVIGLIIAVGSKGLFAAVRSIFGG
mgnify:CR=1 FL=1